MRKSTHILLAWDRTIHSFYHSFTNLRNKYIHPLLPVRKLRLKEVKRLAQNLPFVCGRASTSWSALSGSKLVPLPVAYCDPPIYASPVWHSVWHVNRFSTDLC